MGQPSHPLQDAELHAFVDGQTDLRHRAAFIEALSADPQAQARVEGWKRQNEALHATFGAILLEPVPLRLMPTSLGRDKRPAVRPEPRAPVSRAHVAPILQPPVRGAASRAFVAGVAIAAFLAGALATYGLEALGMAPGLSAGRSAVEAALPTDARALSLWASEAHQAYAGDLGGSGTLSAADEEHLAKSLRHRLSMPFGIPDLQGLGWSLLGGRIVRGERGPATFLVYGRGIDRLGLYMARSDALQSKDLAIDGNGPGLPGVATWVNESFGYALTADAGATWFSRDAPALSGSVRQQSPGSAF